MKKTKIFAYGFIATLAGVIACRPSANAPFETDSLKLPAQKYDYALPSKNMAGLEFTDNPTNRITNAGATLGRVLFYDKKLSLNNSVACASCHLQEKGFADSKQFSVGFQGMTTTRNASAIQNAALENSFFWDMRSPSLENLSLEPVRNHIEMGIEDMSKLSEKLAKVSYYQELFKDAYGTSDINGERISKAISQFLRSMVTYRSKFDEGKKANYANFTAEEMRGKVLFMEKLHCVNCHGGDNFNTSVDGEHFANIGLDATYRDNGIGALTGNSAKNGLFKIPSLRNVGLTAPYMHDGRFENLESVVNHYDNSVRNHANLFPNLRNFQWEGNGGSTTSGNGWGAPPPPSANVLPLALTAQDKKALVAFLKTLTDDELTKDVRFSNPFSN